MKHVKNLYNSCGEEAGMRGRKLAVGGGWHESGQEVCVSGSRICTGCSTELPPQHPDDATTVPLPGASSQA